MANRKIVYASAVTLAQAALDGLASSSTHLAGWQSDVIDNTTNRYLDYKISGKLQVESSGVTGGYVKIYIVSIMNDNDWPDVFTDAGEATKTVTDEEIRDAICHEVDAISVDSTASRDYFFDVPSLRNLLGHIPKKFLIFITQSSGAALESSSDPNQVYVTGSYEEVAA